MTHDEERSYARAAERVERAEAAGLRGCRDDGLNRRCALCGFEEWAHAHDGGWCPNADGWFSYEDRFTAGLTDADKAELNQIIDNDWEQWLADHCQAHGEQLRNDGTGRMYCPVCEQELADERRNDL